MTNRDNYSILFVLINKGDNNNHKVDNSELFFLVWRNTYIRNRFIFHHLRLYITKHITIVQKVDFSRFKNSCSLGRIKRARKENILLNRVHFNNLIDLYKYQNKDYIRVLGLSIDQNDDYIKFKIPSSVTTLELTHYGHAEGFQFKNSIKTLFLNNSPNNIMELKLRYFNEPLLITNSNNNDLNNNIIPSSVTSLYLVEFNQKLKYGDIPFGIKKLVLENYNHPLEVGIFPSSITDLTFCRPFDQILLPGHLPPSLTKLVFNIQYKDRNFGENVIPHGVTEVKFHPY